MKIHGTLFFWENLGRFPRGCISQRGERNQSKVKVKTYGGRIITYGQGAISDCRLIKCRNLSQLELGGKAWGVVSKAFLRAGHPALFSQLPTSHAGALELLRVHRLSAWRALREAKHVYVHLRPASAPV